MKGREIRILTLLGIDTAFFFLEIIVGYAVHSLALVADSFHMLNDIFSLIVALWAVKVAKSRGVDSKYTYGWQRAEILGALINGVFLVALCMSIFLEAIQRFVEPQVITSPKLILVVGAAGLASNLIGLVLFHEHGHSHGGGGDELGHGHSHGGGEHGDEEQGLGDDGRVADVLPQERVANERTALLSESNNEDCFGSEQDGDNEPHLTVRTGGGRARSSSLTHQNHYHAQPKMQQGGGNQKSLNMHGVFLHVLGDALGNVGVIATALFIWLTDYSWKYYMDPVISLVITLIIFSSAMPLCRRASSILLQGVPQSVNADEVKEDLVSLPGVEDIHALHIWILKEDLFIATLHVSVSLDEEEFMNLAAKINGCLHGHGIHSTTIQPEFLPRQQHNSNNNTGGTTSPGGSSTKSSQSAQSGDPPKCMVGGKKSSGGLKSTRSYTNLE